MTKHRPSFLAALWWQSFSSEACCVFDIHVCRSLRGFFLHQSRELASYEVKHHTCTVCGAVPLPQSANLGKIGRRDGSICPESRAFQDLHHILLQWTEYGRPARYRLLTALRSAERPDTSLADLLFPQSCAGTRRITFRLLQTFLCETGLSDRLQFAHH